MKQKAFEAIKNHRKLTAVSAGFVLAVGGLETVAYLQNQTYDTPRNSCESPMAVSESFGDPDASTFFQAYPAFFTTGVRATGVLPADAHGVRVSFKSPHRDEKEWRENASHMIKADDIGRYSLKMAVGEGDVQFGVSVIAPEDSPACLKAPEVDFAYKNSTDYFNSRGDLPWLNPANGVVNIFTVE